MFGTRGYCIVEQNKLKDNHFFGRTIGYSKHIVFNIKIFGEQIVAAAKATFNITISIQYQVKIVSAEIHHFKLDI